MNYAIRAFAPADLPAVLRLEQRCFGDEAWSRNEFAGMYHFGPDMFFVATADHQLIGYICGMMEGREGYIGSIGVDPAARRSGLGTALFDAIKQQFIDHGATTIMLHVRPTNEPALALYRKLGFEIETTEPDYYGVDQPGLYMRRTL